MTTTLIIVATILLIIIIFGIGNHIRLKNQYIKKQHADSTLFQHVLKSMHKQLSIEQALDTFQLKPYSKLLQSLKDKTNYPLTQNDKVQLLLNSDQKYPALKEAIKNAKHHIHMLYYTIQDDQTGQEFVALLQKKVEEGVEVRLLLDGVGSKKLLKRIEELKKLGIEAEAFAPTKLSFIFHINFRNHRKVVVIDGKEAFIGGLNIGDEYRHLDSKKGYWRDIHARIEGEGVLLLQRIFATDWYYATQQKITEDDHYFPNYHEEHTVQGDQTTQEEKDSRQQTALVQVVPSGPDMEEYVIRDAYQHMILTAQQRVWLATPYFVPDQKIINALKQAKQRGVDVRLLVPKKTDNPLVQAASYYFFQELARAGIKIYQFKKGFYHAKVGLIDEDVVKVGSANLDRRSFQYSFEAGLFIYHQETTKKMAKVFEADFQECTLLQYKQIQNRSFWQKTATQLSLLIAPWL